MGKLEAVFFDALGTLIELEPPWPRLRRELAERFGATYTESECEMAMGAEMGHYRANAERGSDTESLAALRHDCAAVLRSNLTDGERLDIEPLTEALMASIVFRPFSEVPATLAELHGRGLELAVLSNWDYELPLVLERTGLSQFFDYVLTSAAIGASKPNAAIFKRALELTSADARSALHVGDSLEADVEGALRTGITAALLVRRSDPPRNLPECVEVISSLTELPALLERRG